MSCRLLRMEQDQMGSVIKAELYSPKSKKKASLHHGPRPAIFTPFSLTLSEGDNSIISMVFILPVQATVFDTIKILLFCGQPCIKYYKKKCTPLLQFVLYFFSPSFFVHLVYISFHEIFIGLRERTKTDCSQPIMLRNCIQNSHSSRSRKHVRHAR